MDLKDFRRKVRKLTDLHGLNAAEAELLRQAIVKLDDEDPITQKMSDRIDALYRKHIDRDDEPEDEEQADDGDVIDEDDFM